MGQDEKKQVSESLKIDRETRKYRYCVIYTNVLKQAEIRSVLKKALPKGRGIVFYPCMECYRRDAGGKMVVRPIFPGYIFIRSDMGEVELHEFIRSNCDRIMAFTRELKLSQRKASGEDIFTGWDKSIIKDASLGGNAGADKDFFPGSGTDAADDAKYDFSDLTEEEAEFMDFLLGVDGMGEEVSGSIVEGDGKKDMPAEGLLKMSYGYQEGSQYKVMKGPLRAYENHIAGVNKHDKKAFLDFEINGKVVRAGLDIMPKRYWFPEDKDTPEVLTDGTEVDLQELAKAMMG